ADFKQISKDEKKLGLSTVLGGCGVRLEELTNLFVTLANQGKWQPLRFSKQDSLRKPVQLISPEAVFLTTEILTQLTRPDLPQHYQNTTRLPKIAWKTGTSYGRRDAWSIGYNRDLTIGVWVGNFSGEGAPALTGTDIATPLLFDLFNALSYNSSSHWFQPTKNIDFRLVCVESGKVPNEFCDNQILDYFIPIVSDNQKCEHLKPVLISADEKTAYCRACLPEAGYKRKFFPNYAPELLTFFEAEGLPYQQLPPHNLNCNRIFEENAPAITSPTAEMEYLLDKQEQPKLLLSCQAENEVKQVYWYINDKFYKAAAPTARIFFKPQPGENKISCTDDKGRNADVFCKVVYY
ncbi:MAG: penicillin-binding protein 1C, partial [Hymenobacteraceae bacterium]|nr:penicillin-binding protein 1C [Hymenobacteraceae bacterium]MDX5397295.1 penicillin-binding protein 1C [Hymenobacteraceae bacterium]MDX5513373.1 penicillin-binding protein 1C [Hymenobacteraceae bacterium]